MDIPSPTTNPRLARLLRERALRKRRDHKRWVRFLWKMVVILIVVLVVEVLYSSAASPRFWIYRIEVRGLDSLTEGEILRFAAVKDGTSYFRVRCKDIERNIRNGDPRVANVVVKRGDIGVLLIDVTERAPLCRVGETTPPLYLDSTRFLFTRPIPPRRPVPVITGIPVPDEKPPYHTLNSPQACATADYLTEFPEASVKGIPIRASKGEVTVDGAITLYLEQGTRIIVGKSEHLKDKAFLLQKIVDYIKDDGSTLDNALWIDTSNPVTVNLTSAEAKKYSISGNYKLKTP
jgi:cell division septal protein FtsQ